MRTIGPEGASYDEHSTIVEGKQHVPAGTDAIPAVRLGEDIVLCRSCTKFCHRCCYEVAEEQCAQCVALKPDAARTPRATSRMSVGVLGSKSVDPAEQYLWDVANENWYA